MTAVLERTDNPPPTCHQCHHEIRPYGVFGWRCDHGCACLILGCVPLRSRSGGDDDLDVYPPGQVPDDHGSHLVQFRPPTTGM